MFRKKDIDFPYYEDAKHRAFYIKDTCDVCGKTRKCNVDGEFENGLRSVCYDCFRKGLACTRIPVSVSTQLIGPDANEKIDRLRHTPPLYWETENQWPCCCNDFMSYEGNWDSYVLWHPEHRDSFADFSKFAKENSEYPIENIQQVYEDLPFIYESYVFSCPHCGKHRLIVQKVQDQDEVEEYLENREEYQQRFGHGRTVDASQAQDSTPYESENLTGDSNRNEKVVENFHTSIENAEQFPYFKKLSQVLGCVAGLCGVTNFFLFFVGPIFRYFTVSAGITAIAILTALAGFFLYFKFPDFYTTRILSAGQDSADGENVLHKCCPMATPLIGCVVACIPQAINRVTCQLQLFATSYHSKITIRTFCISLFLLMACFTVFSWKHKTGNSERISYLIWAAIWSICAATFVLCMYTFDPFSIIW